MNHILLLLFIIILFICAANVSLSYIVKVNHVGNLTTIYSRYFIFLIIYLSSEIIFFYKGYVILNSSIMFVFSFFGAFAYIMYHYFWISFVSSILGHINMKKVLVVLCGVYSINWLLRSMLFVNDYYEVTYNIGATISSVIELLISGILLVIIARQIMSLLKRNMNQKTKRYLVFQCIALLLYILYDMVCIILLFFYDYSLREWPIETYFIDATIFLYASIASLIYLLYINKNHLLLDGTAIEVPETFYFDDEVLQRLSEKYSLSSREMEVLHCLAQGYTYNKISNQLYISVNTTKKHVNSIYRKMDINSRMNLIEIITKDSVNAK